MASRFRAAVALGVIAVLAYATMGWWSSDPDLTPATPRGKHKNTSVQFQVYWDGARYRTDPVDVAWSAYATKILGDDEIRATPWKKTIKVYDGDFLLLSVNPHGVGQVYCRIVLMKGDKEVKVIDEDFLLAGEKHFKCEGNAA